MWFLQIAQLSTTISAKEFKICLEQNIKQLMLRRIDVNILKYPNWCQLMCISDSKKLLEFALNKMSNRIHFPKKVGKRGDNVNIVGQQITTMLRWAYYGSISECFNN